MRRFKDYILDVVLEALPDVFDAEREKIIGRKVEQA
jgi:hypothetical protein